MNGCDDFIERERGGRQGGRESNDMMLRIEVYIWGGRQGGKERERERGREGGGREGVGDDMGCGVQMRDCM